MLARKRRVPRQPKRALLEAHCPHWSARCPSRLYYVSRLRPDDVKLGAGRGPGTGLDRARRTTRVTDNLQDEEIRAAGEDTSPPGGPASCLSYPGARPRTCLPETNTRLVTSLNEPGPSQDINLQNKSRARSKMSFPMPRILCPLGGPGEVQEDKIQTHEHTTNPIHVLHSS